MKLEGADPIEDKIPLNEIEENAQDKVNSRQVPVPPFPNMEEVQSKSAIVFSEMEEHQKSKDEKVQSKSAKVFSKMDKHQKSKDKEVRSKYAIVFSEMEEHQKCKDEEVQSKSTKYFPKWKNTKSLRI
jgi:hypothetical protein